MARARSRKNSKEKNENDDEKMVSNQLCFFRPDKESNKTKQGDNSQNKGEMRA